MIRLKVTGRARGFTLLEVLIAMVLLSFGVLAIASLQIRQQTDHLETYQRSQAIALLQDMGGRMASNLANASAYVTGAASPLGVGAAVPGDCRDPSLSRAEADRCEWSRALQGVHESLALQQLGAMIGARGCIEELVPPDASPGVCRAGMYRVSVAWQGLRATAAPPQDLACGLGLYGEPALRRVAATTVIAGLPRCN